MSVFFLTLYSVVWLITFLFQYKKKGRLDAGNFIILLFFIYSVFSVLLILDKGRGELFFGGKEITLFPLIYLYLMIMLTMKPVYDYNQDKIKRIVAPGGLILDSMTVLYLIAAFFVFINSIVQFREGLTLILLDAAGGLEVYDELMADSSLTLGDGRISNLPSIITNLLGGVMVVVFWFNVVSGRRKVLTYLLAFFILTDPFFSLARSQRGPAIATLLSVLSGYFIFIKFLPETLKKRVRTAGIVLLVLLAIPFMAISHSRFDRSDGGVQSSFLYYIGQENLNFDIYAFDNNGIRYGDRVFPMFKRMLGFQNVPKNFWERRAKYSHLKINDEFFIGYVGDFVLDFGPIITVILFLLFTLLFQNITRIRGGTLYLHQVIVIHFLMYIGSVGGMKLFPYADDGALSMITSFLAFMLFNFSVFSKDSKRLVVNV